MKKLLIIRFTDISRSPRALKQIFWAKGNYKVTVAGFGNFYDDQVEFIQIQKLEESTLSKLKRKFYMAGLQFEKFYWSLPFVREAYEKLKNRKFDLIIAIDLQSLPLAVKIKKNASILFDAAEFYLDDITSSGLKKAVYRRYSHSLMSKYLPYVKILTSPSKPISELYEKLYGVKTAEILNVPFYHDLTPTYPSGSKLKLVHHGAAQANRNLEEMIKGCGDVGDICELHLYLVEDPEDKKYYQSLVRLGSKYENIFFHDPVPLSKLVSEINKYDMGVYMLKPIDKQTAFAMPNKIFEFIQARLGVIISPQKVMKEIVERYDLGIVTQGYNSGSLSTAIKNLTKEEVLKYKQNAHRVASYYCAENFKDHFLKLLEEIQK